MIKNYYELIDLFRFTNILVGKLGLPRTDKVPLGTTRAYWLVTR